MTISLAEMKMPEDGGQRKEKGTPPEKPANDNGQMGERPERKELTETELAEMKKKFEENVTLTGESKTINIKDANFNDFGRGPRDGKKFGENNSQNDEAAKAAEQTKTYKDYEVGDYVFVELTAENSTTAKTVRGVGMMGGMMSGKEPPRKQQK